MTRVKGLFVDPILFDIAHMAVDIVVMYTVKFRYYDHLWDCLKVATIFGTALKWGPSLGLPKSGDYLWDCLKVATICGTA